MTEPGNGTSPAADEQGEPDSRERHAQLLAEAIKVLTEAARLTRPVLTRDEAASAAAGHPVVVDSGRTEQADWAEFVTLALAGAAANVGGIEAVLAGRPGSWEADGVRQLLASTVGPDEEYLLEHRTEPVDLIVHVDEILVDQGMWKLYDDAEQELGRRHDAIGIPTVSGVPGDPAFEEAAARLEPATEEQEQQADELAELEQQRLQDWAAYGAALKANIEAAARSREGLRVPVIVTADVDTMRSSWTDPGWEGGVAEQLLAQAIAATPLPGDGRPPLQRLSPPSS